MNKDERIMIIEACGKLESVIDMAINVTDTIRECVRELGEIKAQLLLNKPAAEE